MKFIFALAMLIASSTTALAGFSFHVSDTTVQAGGTSNIDLFVSAAPTDGFTGLLIAEFNVSVLPSSGGSTLSNFTFNSEFSGGLLGTSSATLNGGNLQARLYGPFVQGGSGVAAVSNSVRLGTLTFNGGTVGSTTSLVFNDPGVVSSAGNDNMVGFAGGASPIVLDGQVFGSPQNTISITAVPEPSSLALLGLVGLAGAGVRYARNRKAKVAAAS